MGFTKDQIKRRAEKVRAAYRLGMLSEHTIAQYETLPKWDWGFSRGSDPRPFTQAREFTRNLGGMSHKQWDKFCVSGSKPLDIPSYPDRVYKAEWVSWGDWLGYTYTPVQSRPFKEAREFVHTLKLKSCLEWKAYCKSGNKPQGIPSIPSVTYKDEFVSYMDWMGYENPAYEKKYRPFIEAREFVHELKLKSWLEWKAYCKSGNKPVDIPSCPDDTKGYEGHWVGYCDWLGYPLAAERRREEAREFKEAREFARSLGFVSKAQWEIYSGSGKRPSDIPSSPGKHSKYREEWVSWSDWLGYNEDGAMTTLGNTKEKYQCHI